MALEAQPNHPAGVIVYSDTVQPVVLNAVTFYPTHKTIGLVPTQAGVERVLHKLLESGFEGAQIELMSGEAGNKFVDATGKRRGVMGQLIRGLQNIQDGRNLVRRYAEAMLEGEYVVAVLCKSAEKNREQAQRERISKATSALLEGEGHSVYFFGPAMVERIVPWRKHLQRYNAQTARDAQS